MGDRKTDAAESLEDMIALNFKKIHDDMMKFDKSLDNALSATISRGLVNAETLAHQITQNAVLAGNIANLMSVAAFGNFLGQLQNIDVQTFMEAALSKPASEAMDDEAKPPKKAKPEPK